MYLFVYLCSRLRSLPLTSLLSFFLSGGSGCEHCLDPGLPSVPRPPL